MRTLLLLFALGVSSPLRAQAPRYEFTATAGTVNFLDESDQRHVLLSPGFRYYLRPTLAISGEVQYLRQQSEGHYDVVLLPSVVWDMRAGRVVPFLKAGAGLIYGSFERFSTTEPFVQGGFGVKVYWGDHWFVAPELLTGLEPHLRLSGTVGYTWPRRR